MDIVFNKRYLAPKIINPSNETILFELTMRKNAMIQHYDDWDMYTEVEIIDKVNDFKRVPVLVNSYILFRVLIKLIDLLKMIDYVDILSNAELLEKMKIVFDNYIHTKDIHTKEIITIKYLKILLTKLHVFDKYCQSFKKEHSIAILHSVCNHLNITDVAKIVTEFT